MKHIIVVASLAIASSHIPASAQGRPADCSDIVTAVSGLTVTDLTPTGCPEAATPLCTTSGLHVAVDNEGQLMGADFVPAGTCGSSPMYRTRIVRVVGGQEQVLATIEDRCLSTEPDVVESSFPSDFLFDAVKGRLFVWMYGCNGGECPAQSLNSCAIDGFVTLRRALRGQPGE